VYLYVSTCVHVYECCISDVFFHVLLFDRTTCPTRSRLSVARSWYLFLIFFLKVSTYSSPVFSNTQLRIAHPVDIFLHPVCVFVCVCA
jgi:hypothetical protein